MATLEPDSTTLSGSTEPSPQWYSYERARLRFPLHFVAACAYVVVALAPLVLFALLGREVRDWASSNPLISLLWAATVALGYQTWAWFEVRSFEPWVRALPPDQRIVERAYFKLNADLAKNFCSGVVGIYAVVALIGIALNQTPK